MSLKKKRKQLVAAAMAAMMTLGTGVSAVAVAAPAVFAAEPEVKEPEAVENPEEVEDPEVVKYTEAEDPEAVEYTETEDPGVEAISNTDVAASDIAITGVNDDFITLEKDEGSGVYNITGTVTEHAPRTDEDGNPDFGTPADRGTANDFYVVNVNFKFTDGATGTTTMIQKNKAITDYYGADKLKEENKNGGNTAVDNNGVAIKTKTDVNIDKLKEEGTFLVKKDVEQVIFEVGGKEFTIDVNLTFPENNAYDVTNITLADENGIEGAKLEKSKDNTYVLTGTVKAGRSTPDFESFIGDGSTAWPWVEDEVIASGYANFTSVKLNFDILAPKVIVEQTNPAFSTFWETEQLDKDVKNFLPVNENGTYTKSKQYTTEENKIKDLDILLQNGENVTFTIDGKTYTIVNELEFEEPTGLVQKDGDKSGLTLEKQEETEAGYTAVYSLSGLATTYLDTTWFEQPAKDDLAPLDDFTSFTFLLNDLPEEDNASVTVIQKNPAMNHFYFGKDATTSDDFPDNVKTKEYTGKDLKDLRDGYSVLVQKGQKEITIQVGENGPKYLIKLDDVTFPTAVEPEITVPSEGNKVDTESSKITVENVAVEVKADTVSNGDSVKIEIPSETLLKALKEGQNVQVGGASLATTPPKTLTISLDTAAVEQAGGKIANISLNQELLLAAQDNNTTEKLIVDVKGADGESAYMWEIDVKNFTAVDDEDENAKVVINLAVDVDTESTAIEDGPTLKGTGSAILNFKNIGDMPGDDDKPAMYLVLPTKAPAGEKYDFFYWDGEESTLMESGIAVKNGTITVPVKHTSTYYLTKAAETPSNNTSKPSVSTHKPGTGNTVTDPTTPTQDKKLDTSSVSIVGGAKYEFLVKNNKDVANIKAESTNTAVAEVSLVDGADARGARYQILAKQAGTAEIKVTYQGVTSTIKVTVTAAGGSFRVDTVNYTLAPDGKYEIGLKVFDEAGKQLTAAQVDALIASGTLKITDSRTGSVANMKVLPGGNVLLTAVSKDKLKKDGDVTYIQYDIKGLHASVPIKVQNGAKPSGVTSSRTLFWAK